MEREREASAAGADDIGSGEPQQNNLTNLTEHTIYTGSQWVILSRDFAKYLVRDERAARWVRIFERRFLSDESFVQTVLMSSPFRPSLVNHNMRYIYWPHYDGDPTSYWIKMGHEFIGGPQASAVASASASAPASASASASALHRVLGHPT